MVSKFIQHHVFKALCTVVFSTPFISSGQEVTSDSLRLTVPQAEAIFLKKNLVLLANQYNVDINKALKEQAKLWDNPVLNTDQNIYDGKFFRHKTENGQQYGQVYIQVQQLIRTAGKISKQTQLAEDNIHSAQAQLKDVLRNLKYILAIDMNNLAALQKTASIYTSEIQTMKTMVRGMNEMLKLGDISQKENVRIKALLFSIQNDLSDNQRQQIDIEKEIAQLLQLNDNVWVVADAAQSIAGSQVNDLKFGSLLDSTLHNRPDLEYAKVQNELQKHTIDYQKALAKPDFNVGIEYDKLNSYVSNYYGLTISVPVPIFNKNKGNIAAARLSYEQSSVVLQQAQSQANKDLLSAWMKLKNATDILNSDNDQLNVNYDVIMKNMTESYRRREVGLTEFIDFFDAYKDTRIKQWQLIANQRNAAAELNFAASQSILSL